MRLISTIGYFLCVMFYEYYDPHWKESMRTDDYKNGSFDGRGNSARRSAAGLPWL